MKTPDSFDFADLDLSGIRNDRPQLHADPARIRAARARRAVEAAQAVLHRRARDRVFSVPSLSVCAEDGIWWTHTRLDAQADPSSASTESRETAAEAPAIPHSIALADVLSGKVSQYSTLPRLLMGADIAALPPFEYIVEGILPRGGLACMSGIPGLAKSFVALHLALCVATGQPFLGRQVERGRVLYITPEGRRGFKKRKAAWEREFNGGAVVDEGFVLLPCAMPFDLVGTKDQPALLSHIGALLDNNIGAYGLVSVVVVDTLAACMTGSENDNDAMMRFVRGLGQLTEALGAGALLLHHPPKSGEDAEGANFFRGSGALMGALDVGLSLRRDKAAACIVLSPAEKMKDDEAASALAFTLRKIDLGSTDNFGQPITSCVLEPCAVPVKASGGKAAKKPTKAELMRPDVERLLEEGSMRVADMQRKLGLEVEGQKARNRIKAALDAIAKDGLAVCREGVWELVV